MAEAVSIGALPRSSQPLVQRNHDKVLTAPTVLSEVLDQTYEVLQNATHLKELIDQMGALLAIGGARARAEKVLQPRELIERYWPLTSRLSHSK